MRNVSIALFKPIRTIIIDKYLTPISYRKEDFECKIVHNYLYFLDITNIVLCCNSAE